MNQSTSGYESHRVIFDFILNKKTGTLHFQPNGRKLYFDSGNLIFANSEHPQEHFSEILVEMGVLEAETLSQIRTSLGESKSLGKHLKEEGIATPKQLAQALKHQITKIIEAVIADANTRIETQENSVPNKLPKLKIQTLALVLQAVSNLAESGLLESPAQDQIIAPTDLFQSRRETLGFPDAYQDFFDFIAATQVTVAQLGREFRWGQRLTDSTLYVLQLLDMVAYQAAPEGVDESIHPITIEDDPIHEHEGLPESDGSDDLLADVLPGPSQDLGELEPEDASLEDPASDEAPLEPLAPEDMALEELAPEETPFGEAEEPIDPLPPEEIALEDPEEAVLEDLTPEEEPLEALDDSELEEPEPEAGEEEFDGASTAPHEIEVGADTNPTLDGFSAMEMADTPSLTEDPDTAEPIQPSLFGEPDDADALDETLVDDAPPSFDEETSPPDDSGFDALNSPELDPSDFGDLGDPEEEPASGFEIAPEESEEAGFGGSSDEPETEEEAAFGLESSAVGFGGFPEASEEDENIGFGDLSDAPSLADLESEETSEPDEDAMLNDDTDLDPSDLETPDFGVSDLQTPDFDASDLETPDLETPDLGDEHALTEDDSIDDVSLDDAFEKSLAEADAISADDFHDLQSGLDHDPVTDFDVAEPSGFDDEEPAFGLEASDEEPTFGPPDFDDGGFGEPDTMAFDQDKDETDGPASNVVMPDREDVVMPDPQEEPEPAPAKKSRVPMMALAAIFLAVILGGGYYYMFMMGGSDPYAEFDGGTTLNTDATPPVQPDADTAPEDPATEISDTVADTPEPEEANREDEAANAANQPSRERVPEKEVTPEEPEPATATASTSTSPQPTETPTREAPPRPRPKPASSAAMAPLTVDDLNTMTEDTLSDFSQQEGNFSLVLVVACSSTTVDNLLAAGAGEPIMVFPRYLDDRTCYMVTWGLFNSLQEANNGKSSLPEQFRSDKDPTWVVNLKKYR